MKQLMLALQLLLGAAIAQGQNADHSLWYASFIGNKQVGYVNEVFLQDGRESVQHAKSKISISRGDKRAEATLESEYVEDLASGILKSIRTKMRMSQQETQNTFMNGTDSITLTQLMGGKSYVRKMASQGSLYGPLWIKRQSIQKLKQIGDALHFKTFSPDFGQFLNGTRKVIAMDKWNGVTALVIEECFVEIPIKRKLWVNDTFETLKTIDATPFGDIESQLTSRENAESDLSSVSFPADFFNRTFAASNVRLKDARSMESVTLKIVKRSKTTLTLPNLAADFQEVLEATDQHIVLKITVPDRMRQPAPREPLPKEKLKEFIEPNALITSDDDEIKKIARNVTVGIRSDYAKCIALENWVTNNMKFDMGIVLAPAAEVCKERKGTCASYTTLLAALFRAAGIPSRYNMGFVYMGGVWGGHAWPDAYIDGQWIPFDAAVNGDGTADAARFSFGAASLINGAGELSAMPGGQLYGSVDVKVLAYRIKGKTYKVADEARSYSVNQNTYSNPTLGLTILKPEGFDFCELDESWPNYTVASILHNNTREKVTVIQTMRSPAKSKNEALRAVLQKQIEGCIFTHENYKGQKVLMAETAHEAAIAVPIGQDVWVILAKSTTPGALLAKALEWVDLN